MNPLSSGKARRLAHLRSESGHYFWAALDHGLTFGALPGLETADDLVAVASAPLVTGVVVNRGMANVLDPAVRAGLVIQMFGGPEIDGTTEKQCLVRLDDAIRLAADAVAVELNFNAPNLQRLLSEVAGMIGRASAVDMPVLVMATSRADLPASKSLVHAVRVSQELGADVIKIGIADSLLTAEPDQHHAVKRVIETAPPVLFAGGGISDAFHSKLRLARALAFQGVCVGRNIFQAADTDEAIRTVVRIFTHDEGSR